MSLEKEDQTNDQKIIPTPGSKPRLYGRIEEMVGKSFAEGSVDEAT